MKFSLNAQAELELPQGAAYYARINAAWPRLQARLVHPAYAAEIYDLAFQRLGQSGAALAQWAAARECGGLSEDEGA